MALADRFVHMFGKIEELIILDTKEKISIRIRAGSRKVPGHLEFLFDTHDENSVRIKPSHASMKHSKGAIEITASLQGP